MIFRGYLKKERKSNARRPAIEKEWTCVFEDRGGDALISFVRIEANSVEILLNGVHVGREVKTDGYPQTIAVVCNAGKNVLTVRLKGTERRGGIFSGVSLIRKHASDWHRKTFGGLCMLMMERDADGCAAFRVSCDGMESAEVFC